MKYSPALDGLRAVAVIAVLAFHAQAPLFGGGFLGVDVFFVLSGFLITSILFGEMRRKDRIDVAGFYKRRSIRLLPALAACLLLYLAVAPFLWPGHDHAGDAAVAATYLSDYVRAFTDGPKYLSHTWSLSVEVHFYLIWPFVILALSQCRVRTGMAVLAGLFVSATLWRFWSAHTMGWNPTYYRFDTRLSGLVAGSLVALICIHWPQFSIKKWQALAGTGLIAFSVLTADWNSGGISSLPFGVLAAEFGAALLILFALQHERRQPLAYPPLVYLGKLSYGIYLFHYPVMVYIRDNYDWLTTLVIGTAIATTLAALSYHTIEAAALNWKKRKMGRSQTMKLPDSSAEAE